MHKLDFRHPIACMEEDKIGEAISLKIAHTRHLPVRIELRIGDYTTADGRGPVEKLDIGQTIAKPISDKIALDQTRSLLRRQAVIGPIILDGPKRPVGDDPRVRGPIRTS